MRLAVQSFALAALLLGASAQARPSVLDYWVKLKPFPDALRLEVDLQNDFMEVVGPWEGGAQMAVWRFSGKDLVGYTRFSCGPACSTDTLVFLDPQQNFKNVTKQVIPELTPTQLSQMGLIMEVRSKGTFRVDELHYFFDLPKTGTTIRLMSGNAFAGNRVLGILVFDQKLGRFIYQTVKL